MDVAAENNARLEALHPALTQHTRAFSRMLPVCAPPLSLGSNNASTSANAPALTHSAKPEPGAAATVTVSAAETAMSTAVRALGGFGAAGAAERLLPGVPAGLAPSSSAAAGAVPGDPSAVALRSLLTAVLSRAPVPAAVAAATARAAGSRAVSESSDTARFETAFADWLYEVSLAAAAAEQDACAPLPPWRALQRLGVWELGSDRPWHRPAPASQQQQQQLQHSGDVSANSVASMGGFVSARQLAMSQGGGGGDRSIYGRPAAVKAEPAAAIAVVEEAPAAPAAPAVAAAPAAALLPAPPVMRYSARAGEVRYSATDKGEASALKALAQACPAPTELTLVTGAQVMLVKNLSLRLVRATAKTRKMLSKHNNSRSSFLLTHMY